MLEGQLVQVNFKEQDNTSCWHYGIIVQVFDNRAEIITEERIRIMYHFVAVSKEEEGFDKTISVHRLYRNNMPVMAKKTIFGKYKFPKNNA